LDYLLPLAGIALAHVLAAMSPGPSFVLVTRAAAGGSRRHGLVAALAMGVGVALWAMGILLGLAAVLAHTVVLYDALRIAGGLYLIVLAVGLWRGAGRPLPAVAVGSESLATGLGATFVRALLVQLSNPKVAVFYGSVFVSLLPQDFPLWVGAAIVAIVLIDETLWYALVATAFSTARLRTLYGRARGVVERAFAGALGALGAKLILDRT